MRKLIDPFLIRLIPWLGYSVIRVLRWTMPIQVIHDEQALRFWKEGRNFILAFWHSRQLMMPFIYKGKKIQILVSQHRDGELIARTVSRFGFKAARGSTTRGGALGLRELIRSARAGWDLAMTPDGPRGPECVVQPGVIALAKMTGLPIVPATFNTSKKKSLNPGIAS